MEIAENQKLIDEINATVEIEASAVVLIEGQAARLRAIVDNTASFEDLKAKISAEADTLDSHSSALAAAVAANTPAAPVDPTVTVGGNSPMAVGDEQTLSVSASDGAPTTGFVSSDPSVATVDENGHVTAVAPGTVDIAVTTETASSTITVTVE